MFKRHLLLRRNTIANLDSILKSRNITLLTKVHIVKATVFSSSHVWIWKLDQKEGWALKNWCFWTVVLERILENPLDCKKIKTVNAKGNQPWIFIGRTDAEAPILWPPDAKSWFIGKDPDAGKNWGQEEKGVTEDEMVGWQSLTQWIWVWANSGRWWRTGKPDVLPSMGSQRVGQDLAIEQTTKNEEFSWHISSTHSVQPVCILKKTRWFLPSLKLPWCWIGGPL